MDRGKSRGAYLLERRPVKAAQEMHKGPWRPDTPGTGEAVPRVRAWRRGEMLVLSCANSPERLKRRLTGGDGAPRGLAGVRRGLVLARLDRADRSRGSIARVYLSIRMIFPHAASCPA